MIGVEPTWITPPDPKSGASANFATSGFNFPGPYGASFHPSWGHIPLGGAKVRDFNKKWKQNCFP